MSLSAPIREEQQTPSEALTNAKIFRFFTPLALSWIFMSVEGPVSVAIISRLPSPEISTAAFQVMMGLAMWIESPVIDLLSTSTTLSRSRSNYVQISRFVWYLISAVTLVHAAVVLTPLYWVVSEHIIGVRHEIAATARLGLGLMLPWSGFIGWRRYLQGILIRFGNTKMVGYGTLVRVITIVLVSGALFFTTELPGIQIAGTALVSSVAAEAMFIHWASRATIRGAFPPLEEDESPPLEMRKLVKFHLPLTATTMLMLMGGPIVSAALSRVPDSVAQLAAFQVASTLIWLMRTTVYALPETVIALYRDEQTAVALRRFCTLVGVFASGTMLVIWLTGLDMVFFARVLGAKPELIGLAHIAVIAAVLTPLIGAMQSYLRGMLTAHHLTVSRMLAIGVHTLCFGTALAVGVILKGNGVLFAGIAFTLALSAEFGILVWSWRVGARRLARQ